MSKRASGARRRVSRPSGPRPRVGRLALLSAVFPGSAQLAAGSRVVGALVIACWVPIVSFAAVFLWRQRADRAELLGLAADANLLIVVRVGLLAAALIWLALFLDAIRLGHPSRLPWWRKIVVGVTATAVTIGVLGGAVITSQAVKAQREAVTEVFSAKEIKPPLQGRYNILLMGSDSGKDRKGFRPDSMTIVSIDADTGNTVLVSLPRNLEKVPFPNNSPMKAIYPDGFDCYDPGDECLLNAVHQKVLDVPGLDQMYPGSSDPALDAQIDAIEGASGLSINYYILINMEGFSDMVDALGGVTIDVKTKIAMYSHDEKTYNPGLVYDPARNIEPGEQKLDGFHSLWYARSRVDSDDYVRMGRQKCLMSAMLSQLSPQKVLLKAEAIVDSSKALLDTTIPASELGSFADLALKARSTRVSTVSLVPPIVDTQNPDFDQIHQMIRTAIAKSESAATEPSAKPTPAGPTTAEPTEPTEQPTEDPTDEERDANNVEDLQAVC